MGEIYDIVQAKKIDKDNMPSQFEKWRYEIVLGLDDPNITGNERPDSVEKPNTYEHDEFDIDTEWRCSRCYYSRYKTMCFGINKAGSKVCEHCNRE